jgi:hypothetical protein
MKPFTCWGLGSGEKSIGAMHEEEAAQLYVAETWEAGYDESPVTVTVLRHDGKTVEHYRVHFVVMAHPTKAEEVDSPF